LVGYAVEEWNDKETGALRCKHLVTLSCNGGDLEVVELPENLHAECAPLRAEDNFGVQVGFMCRHSVGYRNFQRSSVLVATEVL
jgi:hypothetical protein